MPQLQSSELVCIVTATLLLGTGWWFWRASRQKRVPGTRGKVSRIVVFPVKSCRGISLDSVKVDSGGLQHDREWMVVRPAIGVNSEDNPAQMITGREIPKLVTLQPSFMENGALRLESPDGRSVVVGEPEKKYSASCYTDVFLTKCCGEDEGEEVAKFLTDVLDAHDRPLRLIRMRSPGRPLAASPKYGPVVAEQPDKGGYGRYSDWSTFSVVSEQSLTWLEDQVAEIDWSQDRLRTNIVVSTSDAFDEDTWKRFSIGPVELEFLKPCGRCVMTTIDTQTGKKDTNLQPLKFLNKRRRGFYDFLTPDGSFYKAEAFFAINCRHYYRPEQTIHLGDAVTVSSYR